MPPAIRSDGFLALQFAPGAEQSGALLQALAELFASEPRHNRAERKRFEELVQHLISSVEAPARRRFAEIVAARADLPESVALRLAYDEATVAAPIIRLSPLLTAAVLEEIAGLGPDHARLVAERDRKPAPAAAVPSAAVPAVATPETAAKQPPQPAATQTPPRSPAPAAEPAPGHRTGDPDRLAASFFTLSPADRFALVERLGRESWLPDLTVATAALSRFSPETGRQLQTLAKTSTLAAIAERLAAALKVDAAIAARILADPAGEPLLVAARSLGLSESLASELLVLVAQYRAGHAYDFHQLVKFYRRLSKAVADRLLAAWIAAAKPAPAAAARPAPTITVARRVRLAAPAKPAKSAPEDDGSRSIG